MRFSRFGHCEFQNTRRKRLALLRRQARERERYPLFPDLIAVEQNGVDTEMHQRRMVWDRHEAERRTMRARKWREARRRLAQLPPAVRAKLRAYCQRCSWPGDPDYLLSLLHSYALGRIDLHPVPFRETEERRAAVKATVARLMQEASDRSQGTTRQAPRTP